MATKIPIITKRLITTSSLGPHLPPPLPDHYITKAVIPLQKTSYHREPSRMSVSKLPVALPLGRSGKQSLWMVQKSVSSSPSINLRTMDSCALSRVRSALCCTPVTLRLPPLLHPPGAKDKADFSSRSQRQAALPRILIEVRPGAGTVTATTATVSQVRVS